MIDLLPHLRSNSTLKSPCYNRKEQHWNKKGNIIVAKALQEFLKDNKLIK